MTKVIIAGSRNFNDKELLYEKVNEILSTIDDEFEIVSGHCRGADMLGELYAVDHHINFITFPALWNIYGKSAGYIRNYEMAKYAGEGGILIAFPVGESKGTRMMIKIAEQIGMEVFVIEE